MQEITRDTYLNKLIKKDGNGLIKVITGIRRSGKSYLLGTIFYNYLLLNNKKNHIIYLPLDIKENVKYRDGDEFLKYVYSQIKDNNKYYVLVDEIQLMSDFVSVLNSLLYKKNIEVYVTGSNAYLLSKDVVTEFRGRGDIIHIYPLSFKEYMSVFNGDNYEGYDEYSIYGGLPLILSFETDAEKSKYLKDLFEETYLNDIIDRHSIENKTVLDELLSVLSSSMGSLTNPYKLANSETGINLTDKTISKYIDYFIDSFILSKAERYDIKGKKYINSPYKYYFEDIGLRNAKLNFRQLDDGHTMENIIYIELLRRGYNVDVGVVKSNSSNVQYEVDFVCNQGNKKIYIQSSYEIKDDMKDQQERKSLLNINDSFKKIIIISGYSKPRIDDYGIITMGVLYFLLNDDSLNN